MLKSSLTFVDAAVLVAATLSCAYAAVTADAAKARFKDNQCSKCHDVKRVNEGSALKNVAAKHNGKPDAQAKVTEQFNKADKVKTSDAKEVDLKLLDNKNLTVRKKLADWILWQK